MYINAETRRTARPTHLYLRARTDLTQGKRKCTSRRRPCVPQGPNPPLLWAARLATARSRDQSSSSSAARSPGPPPPTHPPRRCGLPHLPLPAESHQSLPHVALSKHAVHAGFSVCLLRQQELTGHSNKETDATYIRFPAGFYRTLHLGSENGSLPRGERSGRSRG